MMLMIGHKRSENMKRPRRGIVKLENLLTGTGRRLNRNALRLQQRHKRNVKKKNKLLPPRRP